LCIHFIGFVYPLSTPLRVLAINKFLAETLNLDSNQLEGTLPPGLGLLTDVITISLRDNKFEGTIPTMLGKLDDVKILSLNHNNLIGSIPPELGTCFRLNGLHLQNNQLTGDIPAEIGQLVSLSDFKLEANLFEGAKMPPQVCALRDDDLSILTSDCKNTDRVACDCCTECH
jgi:Leucine-rich repeat (LRR) protein